MGMLGKVIANFIGIAIAKWLSCGAPSGARAGPLAARTSSTCRPLEIAGARNA
jgi:hypothetical protein